MTKNSKKKCRLEVTVVSGHNLAECNFFFGKSDPFVKLKWHGKKFKTCILRNTVDPVWNDKFLLHFNKEKDQNMLDFLVYDWNMILRNEFMGIARVNILDLLSSEGATRNLSVPVFLNGKQRGHLTLQIKVISCPGDCSETLSAPAQVVPPKTAYGYNQPQAPLVNPSAYPSYANGQMVNAGYLPPTAMSPAWAASGINYAGTKSALSGCVQDTMNIRKLLVEVYGWEDNSDTIRCLCDTVKHCKKPTKKNILEGIKWLMDSVRPGDVLVFQFSGHGSQKYDSTGYEADGKDELIVPLDAKSAGYLTDNDLHRLLVEPLPNGARLTAIMDCCHSGTGLDLPYLWKHNQWEIDDNPFFTPGDVQLISGCRDSQVSYDTGKGNSCDAGGAMTKALIRSLRERPNGHTFASLIETINMRLTADQQPQLSASQQFHPYRPFDFQSIVSNANATLGRVVTNKFSQSNAGGDTMSNLVLSAGGVIGALGGLLLSAEE